jgi:hypothetical protein
MKTIFYLCAATIFSVATISCTKNEISRNFNPANTISTEPVISSKIYTQTNNPFAVKFGQAQAVFNPGDKVVVYLPYAINNDVLQAATIVLTDASSEESLGSYNLLPASHPLLSELNVPYDLWYVPFRFVMIDLNSNYSGRTITMTTTLSGQLTSSTDILQNAFSVQ